MSDEKTPDALMETTPITPEELAKLKALKARRVQRQQVSLLFYHRDGTTSVPLTEGRAVVVGRTTPADVIIRDASLSRQHACLELSDGVVWVEDLGSTNGTRLNGELIERGRVTPGDELTLGGVFTSVHSPEELWSSDHVVAGHDAFRRELVAEVERARLYGRRLTLLVIRPPRTPDRPSHVSKWLPSVRKSLRSFDRLALYSADTLEVLLPELALDELEQKTGEIAESCQGLPLYCGVCALPDHAASAEGLLEHALAALHRCTGRQRVQISGARNGRSRQGQVASGPVGMSRAIGEVFATARKVASMQVPVLIQGQTGTGKEVVARLIHDEGSRRDGPMICVNCGAIPSQLIESTLFGHERGAFTGAAATHKGVFEAAHGGTVLLDEIGELPLQAQAALLRVLEEKAVTRVGSSREIPIDVRIIAATHRDLEEMSRRGDFRKDLLFRLNTMIIEVPPLSQRPDDIEPLVERFIEQANQANGCNVVGIEKDALEVLRNATWMGNVRELRNVIERAVVISGAQTLTVEELPEALRGLHRPSASPPVREDEEDADAADLQDADDEVDEYNFRSEVARFETDLIQKVLRSTGWNRSETARRLGLPVRTLSHRMKALGIRRSSAGGVSDS